MISKARPERRRQQSRPLRRKEFYWSGPDPSHFVEEDVRAAELQLVNGVQVLARDPVPPAFDQE